jgi:hypothetical protein
MGKISWFVLRIKICTTMVYWKGNISTNVKLEAIYVLQYCIELLRKTAPLNLEVSAAFGGSFTAIERAISLQLLPRVDCPTATGLFSGT